MVKLKMGALTRAEARALSRCAPLTRTEFQAQRQLADLRVFPPVARLVDAGADPDQQPQD